MQPTYMVLTHQEEKKFPKYILRRLNQRLRLAWQQLQDETCSRCGTPAWYGRYDDPRAAFKIKHSVCRGCAADEEESEQRDKVKGKKKVYGETTFPIVYQGNIDEPLPRREEWLDHEYEIHKAEQ